MLKPGPIWVLLQAQVTTHTHSDTGGWEDELGLPPLPGFPGCPIPALAGMRGKPGLCSHQPSGWLRALSAPFPLPLVAQCFLKQVPLGSTHWKHGQ